MSDTTAQKIQDDLQHIYRQLMAMIPILNDIEQAFGRIEKNTNDLAFQYKTATNENSNERDLDVKID